MLVVELGLDSLQRQNTHCAAKAGRTGFHVPCFGECYALALASSHGADALAACLRCADPPIIGRIVDERLLLDLRTVPPEQDRILLGGIRYALASVSANAPDTAAACRG